MNSRNNPDDISVIYKSIEQEKWELAAVNTDLQQRLQQTVALAHMQVGAIVQGYQLNMAVLF